MAKANAVNTTSLVTTWASWASGSALSKKLWAQAPNDRSPKAPTMKAMGSNILGLLRWAEVKTSAVMPSSGIVQAYT